MKKTFLITVAILLMFARSVPAFSIGIRCHSGVYGHLYVSLPDCNPYCGQPVRAMIYAVSPDGSILAYYNPYANTWVLEPITFDFGATYIPEVDIAGHLKIPAHQLSRWSAYLRVEVQGNIYEKSCRWCGATKEYCALVSNLLGIIIPTDQFSTVCVERGCGMLDSKCVFCGSFRDQVLCERVEGCQWQGTSCVPTCD